MITIVASYLSGDRDNHGCGVYAAVCNLFNDEARRQGYVVSYDYAPRAPHDTSLVTYTVRVNTAAEALVLLHRCADRGLPTKTHLSISVEFEGQEHALRQAGYDPARE